MRLRHAVAAALAACLLLPAGGSAARAAAPAWTDSTPATIDVTGGTPTSVSVSAGGSAATDVVHISAIARPSFVRLTEQHGNPAAATLTVNASPSLHGRSTVRLVARDSLGNTTPRSLALLVKPDIRPVSLVGPGSESRWAYVLVHTTARAAPRTSARVVGSIGTATGLGNPNLVLLLAEQRDELGRQWVRVLLAKLPNGTTGWVRRTALDNFQIVRTHLVVDRAALTARLYRNDKEIFHASIGVGKPTAPTPAGDFYVREELRNFGDPFYGPVAFGTSARSPTLTDWPGGGFIGIHGTNQPQLLPGAVSHGCIRMRNADILRLARLMPLGTPVTIR
jgi:hypothetical protein